MQQVVMLEMGDGWRKVKGRRWVVGGRRRIIRTGDG